MSPRGILATVVATATLWLAACSSSTSPTAGGGSDLPNGALAAVFGTVTLESGAPAVDADVVLREVVITSRTDTVVAEHTVSTNEGGQFEVPAAPVGRYVLEASLPGSELASVNCFVEVADSSNIVLETMRLRPRVDLVGFVVLPPGYDYSAASVCIPGVSERVGVRSKGMYVLEDVPRGQYDLAYYYDGVVNYLRVKVAAVESRDSVIQLRNVEFAALSVMGDPSHEFHRSEVPVSYAVVPKSYEAGHEPEWYQWVDLSAVEYYRWEGDRLVRWAPESTQVTAPYDIVLSGMIHRDTVSGTVILEAAGGGVYVVTGSAVSNIGSEPVLVTLAARVRHTSGGRVELEVVDIHFEHLATGDTRWGDTHAVWGPRGLCERQFGGVLTDDPSRSVRLGAWMPN
jgi:hypothetical protein